MSIRNLNKFLKPDSIAIIGATDRKRSLGRILTSNLLEDSERKIYAINPNKDEIFDRRAYSNIQDLNEGPDLAVIATPARKVPKIVEECGKTDVPAILIISAGFRETGSNGKQLEEKINKERKKYGIRIVGPNSLGLMRPSTNLNASVAEHMPEAGNTAFISQSGALGPSLISRRGPDEAGFSSFISVGNMIDVDFGDLINYFGKDPHTKTILMHIQSIRKPGKFMSAAKSYCKTKPIILEKPGRHEESKRAIESHIGSIPEDDSLYDSFFKRSGVVRVEETNDLFFCSETLVHECFPRGPNLAIITNAGGPGIMVTDALLDHGGKLANFSDSMKENLNKYLPTYTCKSNPIDISSGATVEDYKLCIEECLEDDNVDGILVIYSFHGPLSSESLAKTVADLSKKGNKPIIACWMGREDDRKTRRILQQAKIPVVKTPEEGARTYAYMYEYFRNKETLYQTPEPLAADNIPLEHHLSQRRYLKYMLKRMTGENRSILMEDESKKFLQTYGIPVVQTYVAHDLEKAMDLAGSLGFPIALKARSPDTESKKKKGLVALNIDSKEDLNNFYKDIVSKIQKNLPKSEIRGFTVQKMIENADFELFLGSKKYKRFGPAIIFGGGGINGKVYRDRSLGFPPLNQVHAKRLIERTKVIKLLEELDCDISPILESLQEYLALLSQLIIDFSEIDEMSIDLIGKNGNLFVVDAKITLDAGDIPSKSRPHRHLIIKPYPLKYIQRKKLKDGQEITVRPIKPEDEPLIVDLFDTFSRETWRHRFFCHMKEITHEDMVKYANVDYRREIAMVGKLEGENKIIGMSRITINPDKSMGEFAVVVSDPWQGLGLGEELSKSIIRIAMDRDLKRIWGTVLRRNHRMINLCRKLGFMMKMESEDTIKVTFEL